MRVVKKPSAEGKKNVRPCVVRLEKVETTPHHRPIKTAARVTLPRPGEEPKDNKGPFKKRLLPATSAPKPKEKPKPKKAASPPIYEAPPTIAASRSRRAIKPNPKYASEEVHTPKAVKSGTTTTASNRKIFTKQRKISISSNDGFFSKGSSEELDDIEDTDSLDKNFDTLNDDDDVETLQVRPVVEKKMRGRPRNQPKSFEVTIGSGGAAKAAATTTTPATPRTIVVSKTTPSTQITNLRKTLAASVNRIATAPSAQKRKLETPPEPENFIARKRFMLTPQRTKYRSAAADDRSPPSYTQKNLVATAKSPQGQTLNGSKIIQKSVVTTAQLNARPAQDKAKTVTSRIVPKIIAKPGPSTRSPNTQNPIMVKPMLSSIQIKSEDEKELGSPPKVEPLKESPKSVKEEKFSPDEADKTGTDGMPTFTIVNINDIISKKGDVLISKAGAVKKPIKSEPDDSDTSSLAKVTRRRTALPPMSSEKIVAEGKRHTLTRAATYSNKKPTVLNHTLNQRLSKGGPASKSFEKPAPRILNSMVAKKLQPVKPLISNFDDSADESFPLSCDDEEEDGDRTVSEDSKGAKSTSGLSAPVKSATPATKENSLAATNRQPAKAVPRKMTPEKVVISRQGDKIIKKITCFETWYVIHVPEDRPLVQPRNTVGMPLIKLANMSEKIQLPNDNWSTKVTLYEITNITISKSSLTTYTGDLSVHNISEEERHKYQPSCVMFRRAVNDRQRSKLPYDRAVIFKNKTFFTNIEGKNVKLIGAPTSVDSKEELETLLEIIDSLTLQSPFVEPATTVQ